METQPTVETKGSVETNANGVGSRDWLGDVIPPDNLDVELALELSRVVHERCQKDVPHDIGLTLAAIVARWKSPSSKINESSSFNERGE